MPEIFESRPIRQVVQYKYNYYWKGHEVEVLERKQGICTVRQLDGILAGRVFKVKAEFIRAVKRKKVIEIGKEES